MKSLAVVFILLTLAFTSIAQQSHDELPTPVRSGDFSSADREYSKVFKPNYSVFTMLMSPYLSSLATQALEDHLTEINNELMPGCGFFIDQRSSEPQEFVDRLSCGADVIVRGTAMRRESRMLDDESYIYSTYEITPTEVFKNNTKKKIDTSRPIIVARPGGRIKLNGVAIKLTASYHPLFATDSEYILFLRYLPLADGFVLSDGDGDFAIDMKSGMSSGAYIQLGSKVEYTDFPNQGSAADLIELIRQQPKRCTSPKAK